MRREGWHTLSSDIEYHWSSNVDEQIDQKVTLDIRSDLDDNIFPI